jgi:hypothetical protein
MKKQNTYTLTIENINSPAIELISNKIKTYKTITKRLKIYRLKNKKTK